MKRESLKIGIIFFITVAVVLWSLNFIFFKGNAPSSKASGETFDLTFDPSSQTTTADNQDFTVTLKVKPSVDLVVRGYSLILPFDKAKLKVKSIDYKAGSAVADLADTTATIATVNTNGTMKLIGESTAATGVTMAGGAPTDLLTLTLTSPYSTSGATLAFDSSSAKLYAIKSDATLFEVPLAALVRFDINGGGPILLPTGTVTPTVTGTSGNAKLKMKLKFQGINSKPADAYNKMAVKVKLLDESTEQTTDYKSADFTADASGVWSGDVSFDVKTGVKYVIYVKGPYHIQKKICDEKPTESSPGTYSCAKGNISLKAGDNNLDFTGIILLAGDLPVQDGAVTAYDTSLVRNNLGKTDADAISKADVNRDGKVDTQDWSLIIAALSVRADEQ